MDIDFKVYAMLVGSAKKMLFAVIVLRKHSKNFPPNTYIFSSACQMKKKKNPKSPNLSKKERNCHTLLELKYFKKITAKSIIKL